MSPRVGASVGLCISRVCLHPIPQPPPQLPQLNIVCGICRVSALFSLVDQLQVRSVFCGRERLNGPSRNSHSTRHITSPQASFMCTTKRPELEQHASNKHPKDTFAKCFPMVQ